MTSNRIFSLNDVATDFSVEELEPRMEMQMFGLGADPSIFLRSQNWILTMSFRICTTYTCLYFI